MKLANISQYIGPALLGMTAMWSTLSIGAVFTAERSPIPKEVLLPNCPEADIKTWAQTGKEPVPLEFLLGVCLFHASTPNANLQAIDALQAAQTRGMAPGQQNPAALLEGLGHCREARKVLKLGSDTLKNSMLQRDLFCMHRELAAGNLNDINWLAMDMSYPDAKEGRSLESHVQEMAACYDTALNEDYDAVCRLFSPLDEDTFKETVSNATDAVVDRYFSQDCSQITDQAKYEACMKRGAESPIGGMFARKIQLSEDTIKGSIVTLDKMQKDAERIRNEYKTLSDAAKPFAEQASEVVNRYRASALLGYQILDEYKRWEKGLWMKGTVNIRDEFDASDKAMVDEYDRIGKRSSETSEDSVVDQTQKLSKVLLDATSDQVKGRQSVKSMCALYFCEIARSDRLTKVKSVCAGDKVNPLCISDSNQYQGLINLENQPAKHVRSICKEVGFDEGLMVVGMKNESAKTCMSTVYGRP